MATLENEDDYSDDDLDALESDDFLKLQEQALNATQYHAQAPPRGQPITADELGLTAQPVSGAGPVPRNIADPTPTNPQAHAAPTYQYLNDARNIDESAAREQWRAQRFGGASAASGLQIGIQEPNAHGLTRSSIPHRTVSSQNARPPRQIDTNGQSPGAVDINTEGGDFDSNDLRQKMEELLREKERWTKEKASLRYILEESKKEVLGKNGEIAVLRSKHTKQLQDQERTYQALQQQHREKEESHRREIEEARKDKERLVTHNRFLDHEVNDQTWNARRSRPVGRSNGEDALASTPRPQRHQLFADGFDDNELETRSPSKPSRQKVATPKAGTKRKRDSLNASPALSPSKVQPSLSFGPAADSPSGMSPYKTGQALFKADDSRSGFVHCVVNYRSGADEPRLLEQLATFCLPSSPETSLYEMFLDKVPPKTTVLETDDIPASIGAVVLELWSKCLTERYYEPLNILVGLTNYILFKGNMATAVRLMDQVVNLAQGTADINVIPRFKKLNKNAKVISAHLNNQAIESSEQVDVHQCLQLIYLTATMCARDQDAMARFWHCMRFDFVSMILRVVQPIPDVLSMIRLLCTCVRHDLLSAIKSQNTESSFAEQHVMDRITSMLIEVPRPSEGEAAYEVEDILKLRLEIMHLLEQISEQKTASHALAVHPQGIGRLVRLMNDELNAIYANPIHKVKRSMIINRAVRILFRITGVHVQEIDLREKLQQQPGGVNKFLITLARLAFSDAIYYERDISEDAFECAHQLLENFVTPEEAESLRAAFVKDDEPQH